MYTYTNVLIMYKYIYKLTHTYRNICVRIHANMYVNVHTYVYTGTHTYTDMFIYIHT